MVKSAVIVVLMILNSYTVPTRKLKNRDYFIVGQNSLQKITYETSSLYSEIYGGSKALDNDFTTSWVSKKNIGPHWIEIDFGIKRLMSKIIIFPGKKDNFKTIKKLKLQFLYKNKWFDFAEADLVKSSKKRSPGTLSGYITMEDNREKIEFDLVGIDASAYRIYIPENATYRGIAAISEIQTFLGYVKIRYFDERLKGLFYPVKNGFLPVKDSSYPNAPRPYRGGRHVGIDVFYHHTDDSYEPVRVTKKTPIYSVDNGVIIRCDLDYKAMRKEEWKKRSRYFRINPRTFVKRSFGGMQIWIDHNNGIVSAYNHLSKIHPDIKRGVYVKKGQQIGWAGNSGLYGEALGRDWGTHLHFEIWVDGYYLGHGMPVSEVRKYVKWIFFPLQ